MGSLVMIVVVVFLCYWCYQSGKTAGSRKARNGRWAWRYRR